MLLWSWAVDEYSIATGHYPFLACEPPSLTEEQSIKAMTMVAKEVLEIESPQVRSLGLSQVESERWPTFHGVFMVVEWGRERQYDLLGNGCGVEITSPNANVTVNVTLPENNVYSIRRG
jgi:hypothetical protein